MRAAFRYSFVGYVHSAVAVFYGRQPMRDNERSSTLEQLVQPLLEQTLGFGVDG
ncbi:hypothetical protein D1872_326030 [compost metagenome]